MTAKRVVFVIFAIVFGLGAQISRAGMIIEFESVLIQAGQSGFIDVYLRSADIDQISQYSVQFVIQHVRGQGIMEFSPSQK